MAQRIKIVSVVYQVYSRVPGVEGWIQPVPAAPTFETQEAAVAYIEKYGYADHNYVIHEKV
jgi:hypothetical protein